MTKYSSSQLSQAWKSYIASRHSSQKRQQGGPILPTGDNLGHAGPSLFEQGRKLSPEIIYTPGQPQRTVESLSHPVLGSYEKFLETQNKYDTRSSPGAGAFEKSMSGAPMHLGVKGMNEGGKVKKKLKKKKQEGEATPVSDAQVEHKSGAGSSAGSQHRQDGGIVEGKGGIDTNPAAIRPGSFVVPKKKVAEAIKDGIVEPKKAKKFQAGGVPVKLTAGEAIVSPEKAKSLYGMGVDLNQYAPDSEYPYTPATGKDMNPALLRNQWRSDSTKEYRTADSIINTTEDAKLKEDMIRDFYETQHRAEGGGIHIKKSKRGSLHKALGVPQGEKIPASKLADKPGDSPAMKKKKVFARNAKKWQHKQDGGGVSDVQMAPPIEVKTNNPRLKTKSQSLPKTEEVTTPVSQENYARNIGDMENKYLKDSQSKIQNKVENWKSLLGGAGILGIMANDPMQVIDKPIGDFVGGVEHGLYDLGKRGINYVKDKLLNKGGKVKGYQAGGPIQDDGTMPPAPIGGQPNYSDYEKMKIIDPNYQSPGQNTPIGVMTDNPGPVVTPASPIGSVNNVNTQNTPSAPKTATAPQAPNTPQSLLNQVSQEEKNYYQTTGLLNLGLLAGNLGSEYVASPRPLDYKPDLYERNIAAQSEVANKDLDKEAATARYNARNMGVTRTPDITASLMDKKLSLGANIDAEKEAERKSVYEQRNQASLFNLNQYNQYESKEADRLAQFRQEKGQVAGQYIDKLQNLYKTSIEDKYRIAGTQNQWDIQNKAIQSGNAGEIGSKILIPNGIIPTGDITKDMGNAQKISKITSSGKMDAYNQYKATKNGAVNESDLDQFMKDNNIQ